MQNAPDVPPANWNDQKAIVTGYTQPGNKYFATRQRLAYHPRDKTFQPEIAVSAGSGGASTQTAPPPKPVETASPPPPPQKSSKEKELEAYEKEFLVRHAKEQEEKAKKAEAKKQAKSSAQAASAKGAMPKGF